MSGIPQGKVLYEVYPRDTEVSYSEGFLLFGYENWNRNSKYPHYFSQDCYGFENNGNGIMDHYYESVNGIDKIDGHQMINGCQYEGFEDARPFSEGLAAVRFLYYYAEYSSYATTLWHYINHNGSLIHGSYQECGNFSCGLAPVQIGWGKNNWGYINKLGEVVIPPKFASASEFHNDLALVAVVDEEKPFRIIDKNANEIFRIDDNLTTVLSKYPFFNVPWKFIKIEKVSGCYEYLSFYFENSLFQYGRNNGKICTIDKNGTQYWED